MYIFAMNHTELLEDAGNVQLHAYSQTSIKFWKNLKLQKNFVTQKSEFAYVRETQI